MYVVLADMPRKDRVKEKRAAKNAARFQGFTNATSLCRCHTVNAAAGFIGDIQGAIWAQ
jgi:hypothetical protein